MRSQLRSVKLLTATAMAMLCSVACSDMEGLENAGSDGKLRNSQISHGRTEVGRLSLNGSMCTGTLIRPNVVLSAAHCVDYRSGPGNYGSIILANGSFEINGALSFSNTAGAADIVLLELSFAVPGLTATPAQIHPGPPRNGSRADVYGYGCNERADRSGPLLGQKQTVSFTVGDDTWLGPTPPCQLSGSGNTLKCR